MSGETDAVRTSDPRGLYKELADAFRSPDGQAVARHLARMLQARSPEDAQPASAPGARRVGIWQQNTSGDFTRSAELAGRWSYWANVTRIPAKHGKKRVVLLGESVARGFLYDPSFNLAKAMDRMLNSTPAQSFEVVDLACTNQSMSELVQTLHECTALAPDALVIFAGNNWAHCAAAREGAWEPVLRSAALRDHGILGLKTYIERSIGEQVAELIATVDQIRTQANLPVVFVIPEFNLVDWHDARAIAPQLGEGKNAAWNELRDICSRALADGNVAELLRASTALITLDQGTSAWSLRMRAEAALRLGDTLSARTFLERSRDAELWDHFPHTPRCYSIVQSTLRSALQRHSIRAVDLPRIFADAHPEELAGRRLFIDYCHLSVEGIRYCAAHLVATLCSATNDVALNLHQLLGVPFEVDPRVEAQAHFAAAIHNAHWGHASGHIVEHHCATALQKAPHIADQMQQYVDLLTRRAPAWSCSSTQMLAESAANPSLARYILGMLPQQPRVLDEDLLSILARLTGTTMQWRDLRIREHARHAGITNLLEPLHSLGCLTQRESMWLLPGLCTAVPDYYRSFSERSEFYLFEEAPGDCELLLTARLPEAGAAQVYLDVNGAQITGVLLDGSWKRIRVPLSARHLQRGLNTVAIRWPTPRISYESAIEHAASCFERAERAELFPVLGEIHSFECAPPVGS